MGGGQVLESVIGIEGEGRGQRNGWVGIVCSWVRGGRVEVIGLIGSVRGIAREGYRC